MADRTFTAEELQNMRVVLAQHDKQGIKEFDLNNPPKVPYKHQEYPKMMYRDGETKVAQNVDDEEAAIAAGWATNLYPVVAPQESLKAEEYNEPAEKPKSRRR